jgi:DNA-binding MarR family transcriptional regulator
MDAILFGLKRADQVAIRFGHRVLAPFGLTPARFDMLFAVGRHWSTRQSELRRALGVARSTASRMLGLLERLGWVRRHARRHTRRVELTDAGRALLARTVRKVCGRRLPYRRVAEGIRVGPKSGDFVARDRFEGVLATFRKRFGDRATLCYPWYEDH